MKNIVERIAKKRGMKISVVNPRYTSQTCPHCGHIDKDNRPTQEEFVCTECGYTANADVNAARNIQERITIPELRKALEWWNGNAGMYVGRKISNKTFYQELYKRIKAGGIVTP